MDSLVRRYCCCCRRGNETPATPTYPVFIKNPHASPPQPIAPPKPPAGVAPPGQLYVSLWDFQARTLEELCFSAGDVFQVLEKSSDWWKAKKVQDASGKSCNEIGYVPQNYLEEKETGDAQPWLFRDISRSEATNMLLSSENERGTFLIRASEKKGFEYALSVRDLKDVRHFKILKNNEGRYHVNNMSFFPDLESFIEHYKKASLNNGLMLTWPCAKQEPVLTDLSHDSVDVWERPREEFELGKKLGSGNFGNVSEAMWNSGHVQVKVAIKVMKEGVVFQKDFQEESKILKTLQHRHLLTLYAICSKIEPYYIITELMPKGDLLKLLRKFGMRYLREAIGTYHSQNKVQGNKCNPLLHMLSVEGRRLSPNDLLDMAYQVVDGMEYLESKGYIHRDLAARNVLVGRDNLCKIADFGLARIITDDVYLSQAKNIPYKWTAPEALTHGRFSTKADVWSFGVLLFEIVTHGQIPYTVLSNTQVLEELSRGYRMPRPKECSEKIYSVMLNCWEQEPIKRPTFAMLKVQLESLAYYEETEYYPN